jgi:hypothetical protein
MFLTLIFYIFPFISFIFSIFLSDVVNFLVSLSSYVELFFFIVTGLYILNAKHFMANQHSAYR